MMDLSPLTQALVGAAAMAVTTLAGFALARLPLLLTYLRVSIDGSDATRLRYAIANRAEIAMQAIEGGMAQDRAVEDMVSYARDALPRALRRLELSDEALRTMCEAQLARLMAGRA
jgi:hypothetical protein